MLTYISQFMTLYPGDLLLTGTPAGVGKVSHHDKLHATLKSEGHLI